ncbi:hypothetical protein K7432_012462 [Basidiobolus ranarum]|uniref:Uncharacterized protein n=1 Tax=Basidiobolus ranarum TaxID=34480 RepID=A0ABR2WKQ4_9FUNG
MVSFRQLVLLISFTLYHLNIVQSESQEVDGSGTSKRGDAPTITIVSTYTEIETTSVMLTTIRDSGNHRSTPTKNLTEHVEETSEVSGKEEHLETTSTGEKETTWDSDRKIMDPPTQPLSMRSILSATSTFQHLATTFSTGVTPGPTLNNSPISHSTGIQSFNQSSSRTNGSVSPTGSPLSTLKPSSPPGHRNIGSIIHQDGCWLIFWVIAMAFSL